MSDFLTPVPENYKWPHCPEADAFVRETLSAFLGQHAFAGRLSQEMKSATNTEFQSWTEYVIVGASEYPTTRLEKLGFAIDKDAKTPEGTLYWHPLADLPRVLVLPGSAPLSCAIMVDSISDFLLTHRFTVPIEGAPYGLYREARLPGEKGELRIVERRGTRSIVPDREERAAKMIAHLEAWTNRRRQFGSLNDALEHTLSLAKKMAADLGPGPAAWAFLEGERRYWQSRNRAGQVQKARQDKLGLGWSNHDHHTFRSGRPAFPKLMDILLAFGFKKRERYYAGAEAGWGAQILEQPDARLIIFADVDLTPDEVSVDFTKTALADLKKPGTVGLWCALHGESILDAGMHHLEAKFHFDGLRDTLKASGVNFMKPFSDFPHLRQAFSEGELWMVPKERLDALLAAGKITADAYSRMRQMGAVGSHLENLQRRDGFKGFNQRGVSEIIKAVNPEAQALKGTQGATS